MTAPALRTTTYNGSYYDCPKGCKPHRSATSWLSAGVPKPALKAWGEGVVAAFAFDHQEAWKQLPKEDAIGLLKKAPFNTTGRAAVKGSDVHDWAERYVLGNAIDLKQLPIEQQPYAQSFLKFLDDWKPDYEMTEASVFNCEHDVAGTLDFIARINGLGMVLGDIKTGKGVYPEVCMQLACYRYSAFIAMPDGTQPEMPKVDTCAVLHLTAKGYELIPVDADELAYRYFRCVQRVARFVLDEGKAMVHRPLFPSKEEVA